MTEEEHLTHLIRNSEQRFIELNGTKKTKGLIALAYEQKLPEWHMKSLKELRNEEEKWLKSLQEEQKNLRQGLNVNFCYER